MVQEGDVESQRTQKLQRARIQSKKERETIQKYEPVWSIMSLLHSLSSPFPIETSFTVGVENCWARRTKATKVNYGTTH